MRASSGIVVCLAAVTAFYVFAPALSGSSSDEFQFVVFGMPFEDRLFEDGYARDFEARHPGLEVRYDRYPEVNRKYYAWHLRGVGADVMRLTANVYHRMVARGLLEPLGPFMDDPAHGLSEEDRRDFPASVWKALEIDGERYALPSDHNLWGLFWNRTMFAEAGIEPPTNDWTWDDLRAAAEALTIRRDGQVVQNGIDFSIYYWPFYVFLRQAGGTTWDAAQTTTRIASPEGLEALTFLTELVGSAPSIRTSATSNSATGPDKLFAAGRTAMFFDGSWRVPGIETVAPDLDFAVVTLPRHKERAVIGTSVLWAMSVHTEDKALAWDMIQWMTSREQGLRYWDTLRVAPPARMSILRSAEFRRTDGIVDSDGTVWVPPMPADHFDRRARWLLDGLLPNPVTGEPAPAFLEASPYQPDLDRAVMQMLSRAVSPSRTETFQELLDTAAEQVHGIIDRNRSARGLPPVSGR
jgi:multiple sugar transport system substrate-binding protein